MAYFPLDVRILEEGLPEAPGVYLFKGEGEKILYVGKARDLKKRVLSYFFRNSEPSEKTKMLLRNARALDVILTSSENEAFILERNLIKRHMPRYNILLRDDKQYPLVRIDLMQEYPSLEIVRRPKQDNARYFGPFSSSGAMRETLRVLHKAFPLRKCKGALKPRTRPCINYQMHRCLGPCTGSISKGEYQGLINQAIMFLEGRTRSLIEVLTQEMVRLSEEMEFERAAIVRDRIRAIKRTVQPQAVDIPDLKDRDIIGIASHKDTTQVVVWEIREGHLVETSCFSFEARGEEQTETLEAFIKQYYPERGTRIPSEILIPFSIEEATQIGRWLATIKEGDVNIKVAKTPQEKRAVHMAITNAQRLALQSEDRKHMKALDLIGKMLSLDKVPRYLECVDISNLQGNAAVGSVVAFIDGRPYKRGYRSFHIKSVENMDDSAMMAEVIRRRLKYEPLPDLFILDGGKGHLNIIKKLLEDLDKANINVIAIAKERESNLPSDKIYIPGRKNPIILEHNHPALLLLMAMRDEAHRRAVALHHKRYKKETVASVLSGIPGLGPKRIKALLIQFGSLERLKRATIEELESMPGLPKSLAKTIFEKLNTVDTHAPKD